MQRKHLPLLAAVMVLGLVGAAITLAQGDDPNPTLDPDPTVRAGVEAALTATAERLIPPEPTRVSNADAADDDAFLGPVDAPVVIVEFSDFQCGYCGRWYQEVLPQIRATYPDEVKFVYRDFVIFGEDSARAAQATECAEEQGAFWDMHDAIFDSGEPSTQDMLVGLAGDIGLDAGAFEECLTSERYLDEVLADYQDATSFGFGGTPGFVINGQVHAFGAQPFETFDRIIQQELANPGGQTAPATATPPPGPTTAFDATVAPQVDAALTATAAFVPTNTPLPTRIPRSTFSDDDAFLGPADAPVVIVEFSDFQCGFCGRWYRDVLPQIREQYPDAVKFVYRDYPIFGADSVRAAHATECAEEQGAFWEMHNLIFDKLEADERPPFDQVAMVSYAGELGLDTGAFEECMASERYMEEIINDARAAREYGFQGTPGFIINGVVHAFGAQPFETFDRIIQDELARASDAGAPDTDAAAEPAAPSAANWSEAAPGQYMHTNANALIIYEITSLESFVLDSGLAMPDSDTPLLDVLAQAEDSLQGQVAEMGLASDDDPFTGPQHQQIGEMQVAALRLMLPSQFDGQGQFFAGIDTVWMLIDRADDGMSLVIYQYEGDPSPAVYDDFLAWLAANMGMLTS